MVKDRTQAIDVHAGIGKEGRSLAVANYPFTVLILLGTLNSTLAMNTASLG